MNEDDEGVVPTSDGPPEVMTQEEFFRPNAAPAADGPPEVMTPDEFFREGTSTRVGSFARGATEGVIPGIAGMGGAIYGAAAGAAAGSAIMPGFGTMAGGIIGGLGGGLGVGYGASKLQEAGLEASGLREGDGWFGRKQREADEALFPYSRFGGEMLPAMTTLRPGGRAVERVIGGGLGGVVGAATDYYQTGHVDPVKVGMAAAAGAAMPNVNRPTHNFVEQAMPRSWRTPGPPPAPAERPAWETPGVAERPQTSVEQELQFAREQRDDPHMDPVLREHWDRSYNETAARLQAERAGYADPETSASQGQGPTSTPANANPAVNQSGGLGTAPAGHRVAEPSSGNPVGAPMAAREAAQPRAPGRSYGKDTVAGDPGQITQPSVKVASDLVPADMRAALGGWENARETAPTRAVAEGLVQGVREANTPPPRPLQRAAAGTPPAAFRRGEAPITPPQRRVAPRSEPALEPVTAAATRGSLTDTIMAAMGGDAKRALQWFDGQLAKDPKQASSPDVVQAYAEIKAKTAEPPAAPVAAAPVAPAVSALPAAPAPKTVPVVASAPPAPLATQKAIAASRQRKAPKPAPEVAPITEYAPEKRVTPKPQDPYSTFSPRAREIIERNRQREQIPAKVDLKVNAAPEVAPVNKPAPVNEPPTAGELGAPSKAKQGRKKSTPATQAAVEGKPPAAATAPKEAVAPEVTAPVTPEQPKFVPKPNTVPLEAAKPAKKKAALDITAKMTPEERSIWEKLKTGAKKAAADEEGGIDIGRVEPDKENPRFTHSEATDIVTENGAETLNAPGSVLADLVTALSRGSSRWALNAVGGILNKFPGLHETKPNLLEARDILAKRAESEPVSETNVPATEGARLPRRKVTDEAETTEAPDQRPAPTGRKLVFDPVTGEPREPKIWRTEPEQKAEGGEYTPEEMGRVGQLMRTLDPEAQPKLIELMQSTPKQEFMPAVERMLGEAATEAGQKSAAATRRGAEFTLSTGAKAAGEPDYRHKQGILDANEKAYAGNPKPEGDETNMQLKARAGQIVREADEGVRTLVADLKGKWPESKEFTGEYLPARDRPASTDMVAAARRLLGTKNPSQAKYDAFRASENLAGTELEAKARRIEGDVERRPNAPADAIAEQEGRPEHFPQNANDPEHVMMTTWLNGLSERDYRRLQNSWDVPLDMEVQTTKEPMTQLLEMAGKLDELKANPHAFEIVPAEDMPTAKSTPITGLPNRPDKFYKRTVPGAAAAEGRKLIPGTPEFKKAAAEATESANKPKPIYDEKFESDFDAQTERNIAAQKSQLERAQDFFGAVTWKMNKERLEKLRRDEFGGLDVTRIFDWIDKVQKKFRPEREPMTAAGMTRLYKGEEGKWSDVTRAEIRDSGSVPTRYADVPSAVVEQYRDGNTGSATGKAADRFAKKWDDKIALNPDAPDRRVPLEPEQEGMTDFLRRLWADENGALDVTRLPQWVPNARNKLRDFFSPAADRSILDYADQISLHDSVKLRTEAARPVQKLMYDLRKATYEDGTMPSPSEAGVMYRAWENGAVTNLPEKQRAYVEKHLDPVMEKAAKVYDELRDIMVRNEYHGYKNMPERVENGPGYAKFMYRRTKKAYDQEADFDPITNRNSLSLWTQSIEARDWFTVQAADGKRTLYRVNEAGDVVPYKNREAGSVLRRDSMPADFDPTQVGTDIPGLGKIDHAKIDEIMTHGRGKPGEKLEFYDHPLMVAADAYVGMTRSLARAKFLERLENDPKFIDYRAASKTAAEEKWGAGNVAQTTMPQFERSWFPKQVAWALDDMVKQGFNYNGNKFMEGLARLNQAALKPFYFIGPEVHVFNELDKYLVGRGYDNLNLPKTFRTFGEALKSVRNQDALQAEIMEAGGNPMFMHSMVSRALPNIARILKADFKERPWKHDPIRKVFGYDIKPAWEHAYQESNKMMWWQSDVLYTAIYNDMKDRFGGKDWRTKSAELEKLKGVESPTAEQVTRRNELMGLHSDLARKAVHETEKIIDSYVVPTTFGKSVGLEGTDAGRAFQKFLVDPATANFGRFSYGLYKTLANVVKNMAGQNENMSKPASMALGASQAGMLLVMANVIYPYMSKAYSQAPWAKPESEVEKRGVTSIATIPSEIYHKGVRDGWSKLARRAWSPAAFPGTALPLYENRDFVGRPILDSAGGAGKLPGQAAEFLLGQLISPAGQVSRSYAQEGPDFALQRFLESNFGLKTPSDAQVRFENRRESEDTRRAKSRERHSRGLVESGGNWLADTLRGY